MEVRWDPEKARTNFQKHRVRFADAELVLFDPRAVSIEDANAQGEQRHVSIGTDAIGRVLIVVYTYRGDHIRIISARKATRKERRSYEEGL